MDETTTRPWVETVMGLSHGRRIVSHVYHDHLQRVRCARAQAEWAAGVCDLTLGRT
jgi:hypothetical protein